MFCLYMFFLSLYRDHRDLHVLTHSFPTRRSSDRVHPVTAREPLQERLQPRAFAPSPSKAGEGWGGVSLRSARTVGTPSQPTPAFAGGGARAEARGCREFAGRQRTPLRPAARRANSTAAPAAARDSERSGPPGRPEEHSVEEVVVGTVRGREGPVHN